MSNLEFGDQFSFDKINKSRKETILKSFDNNIYDAPLSDIDQEISKAIELDVIEKGGKRATFGEIREWSGKKYQKTTQGWIPVKGEKGEKKEEKPGKHPDFDKYYNEYLDGDKNPTAKDRNDASRYAHSKIESSEKKEDSKLDEFYGSIEKKAIEMANNGKGIKEIREYVESEKIEKEAREKIISKILDHKEQLQEDKKEESKSKDVEKDNMEADIDFTPDDDKVTKYLEKKFKVKFKETGDTTANVIGKKEDVAKFLSHHYESEEDAKDLHPEFFK